MRAAVALLSSDYAAPQKKGKMMAGWPDSRKPTTSPLRRVLIQLVGVWLVVLIAGHELYGQSCAMCYTTVAGGGKSVIHALQGGIIVLLIPPVLLFSGLTILLFRWRTSASSRTLSGQVLSGRS
jgi:hypothetical protein